MQVKPSRPAQTSVDPWDSRQVLDIHRSQIHARHAHRYRSHSARRADLPDTFSEAQPDAGAAKRNLDGLATQLT